MLLSAPITFLLCLIFPGEQRCLLAASISRCSSCLVLPAPALTLLLLLALVPAPCSASPFTAIRRSSKCTNPVLGGKKNNFFQARLIFLSYDITHLFFLSRAVSWDFYLFIHGQQLPHHITNTETTVHPTLGHVEYRTFLKLNTRRFSCEIVDPVLSNTKVCFLKEESGFCVCSVMNM